MHVVVADDDRDILELVGFALQRAGHQVSSAADGQQALQTVQEARPDAVLLDVSMPQLSGLQVCQQLRSQPRFQYLPIMILTANAQQSATNQATEAGANAYLAKPFTLTQLVDQVEALVR